MASEYELHALKAQTYLDSYSKVWKSIMSV